MRHKQVKAHYNHIMECNENHPIGNAIDISSITSELNSIKNEINEIKRRLENTEIITDNASIKITPTPPIGVEDLNGTAYTALLASVSTPQGAEDYYNAVIAPIVAKNGGDLTAPILRSELNAAVCSSLFTEATSPITWNDIDDDARMAYVMQFILANDSNQTRAIYLTNEILKGMSVDFRSINGINQEFLANFLAPQIEDDPALILPENAGIRMRSCPYLLS